MEELTLNRGSPSFRYNEVIMKSIENSRQLDVGSK